MTPRNPALHVHVTQVCVEPHTSHQLHGTCERACDPQGQPVFAPLDLVGFREDLTVPHSRCTWRRIRKRCGGMTHSGAVGARANATSALCPKWDRKCALFAAIWPDNMVIFLKCLLLPTVLPLTWFLRYNLGGRLPLRRSGQLGRSTIQLALFRENVVDHGTLTTLPGKSANVFLAVLQVPSS